MITMILHHESGLPNFFSLLIFQLLLLRFSVNKNKFTFYTPSGYATLDPHTSRMLIEHPTIWATYCYEINV